MKFRDYQERALGTDQVPQANDDDKSIIVPLLGLAGETGSLLTEYKKSFREGNAYQIFRERISEELGDILWYVSNIATKANLDLEDIAQQNLDKISSRWLPPQKRTSIRRRLFDDRFASQEQFPRTFRIAMHEVDVGGQFKVAMELEGKPLGDPLTDNAYEEDGYSYHDIFHLSYAAVLGWSPVIRKLMGRKRKSDPKTDEIEDGGRATAIEEGISALVFDYARDHSFLENVDHVSYDLLRIIKQLTRHLEVAECSENEWQDAIIQGFAVWRQFLLHRRGTLIGDLFKRTIRFERNSTKKREASAENESTAPGVRRKTGGTNKKKTTTR